MLTGRIDATATIADRVLNAKALPTDAARFDRLVLIRARELIRGRRIQGKPPTIGIDDAEVLAAMTSLLKLPQQSREAFILRRIDALDELHTSRAMDCSKTATANHLSQAERMLHEHTGTDPVDLADLLRQLADGFDHLPDITVHRERRRLRRKRRWVVLGLAITLIVLLVILGVVSGSLGILPGFTSPPTDPAQPAP